MSDMMGRNDKTWQAPLLRWLAEPEAASTTRQAARELELIRSDLRRLARDNEDLGRRLGHSVRDAA